MTTGIKRARIEKDFKFNFIPKLTSDQIIFNNNDLSSTVNQSPKSLNINTLTRHFNARLNQFEKTKETKTLYNKPINSISFQHQETKTVYEPIYLKHQDILYTIIIYIQMAFNIIISSVALYIFTNIILAIKQDFRIKAEEYVNELHKEKLMCTNNYLINHCGETNRIPAIEDMCNNWAACMNKDIVVAQAKVYAEAIAEIINSFVEPISYKTLLVFSLLTVGTFVFSNMTFNLFKKNYHRSIQTTQAIVKKD
ncbi:Di-sulfide bridge nucleocytoplasmic transport domain-containing protein [Cokeromyces recurvatus]|uniref:Di-sulfide bridge nucleocytoplasmic transport domain-containing protein n=1 Tax=Cokeromyces recurvatus TaxID=90255 RepID=UPI00221F7FE4|nr:Di-sulfide bridge nucleocytoplasmic transport domain-containing protein [Cokeromyces recurvatus]KAI7903514.1 Di-sulfide bridge nucleocytoplasmic transport domain-containing protein [Cokeromyces recurvatus]